MSEFRIVLSLTVKLNIKAKWNTVNLTNISCNYEHIPLFEDFFACEQITFTHIPANISDGTHCGDGCMTISEDSSRSL